jgi:RNA-splicing ligase RtcB
MYDVIGRYNTATIYALHVDSESYAQVLRMCNTEELQGSKIRMMPDMHASEGCTVGTSMTVTDKVNPAYVGGDIGCGMQVYRLRERTIDFAALDDAIRTRVPAGAAIFEHGLPAMRHVPLDALYSRDALRTATVRRSLGTLGGGNHFIEVDYSQRDAKYYLVIHSGSRKLGADVCRYYQHQAELAEINREVEIRNVIERLKAEGRTSEIQQVVSEMPRNTKNKELAYISGGDFDDYLNDMKIVQQFAALNRATMANIIIEAMGLTETSRFETIHNYIDFSRMILRKGAVRAEAAERLLIPINMRDGSLICVGKGNPDWNYSAPHGAGRLMSRSKAKEQLSMEEYQTSMNGIYTTSVTQSTIDEAPQAYKPMEEIVRMVADTVEIDDIIKPVYNFKAAE